MSKLKPNQTKYCIHWKYHRRNSVSYWKIPIWPKLANITQGMILEWNVTWMIPLAATLHQLIAFLGEKRFDSIIIIISFQFLLVMTIIYFNELILGRNKIGFQRLSFFPSFFQTVFSKNKKKSLSSILVTSLT